MSANAFKQLWSKIRNFVVFRPEDPTYLQQVTPQFKTGTSVERIKGFRYPSPGSRPQPVVPIRENEDRIYNTSYFTHDPTNIASQDVLMINTKDPKFIKETLNRLGSPGIKNEAVLRYDPTGLRSTMTSTWKSLDESLALNATPDHLPEPYWNKDEEALQKERAEKELPAAMGKVFLPDMSPKQFQLRW